MSQGLSSLHQPFIEIRTLRRAFGGLKAVDDVTLDIGKGEFFSLLGPSGCGKTTLMRMIAGFEQPDSGTLTLAGRDLLAIPPNERPVNMMFQSYALFPHMSVRNNVSFGLNQMKLPRSEVASRCDAMLALVQLEALAERMPHQLSGGQKQRVALARALARQPDVLLLDEPLGALDKSLRQETQSELKRIQASLGTTLIVVTHDQEEAMILSDRIAVMRVGRIEQIGTPSELYNNPANLFVAGFIGEINAIPVSIVETRGDSTVVSSPDFVGPVMMPGLVPAGRSVRLAIRPERLQLVPVSVPPSGHALAVTVVERSYRGANIVITAQTVSGDLLKINDYANLTGSSIEAGQQALAQFSPADARLLPA